MLNLISFLVGVALGVINYRMFVKSIRAISTDTEKSKSSKQIVAAGLFRHLFIFLAGIWLIRVASLDPSHLCGGLLLATYACRIREIMAQRNREE